MGWMVAALAPGRDAQQPKEFDGIKLDPSPEHVGEDGLEDTDPDLDAHLMQFNVMVDRLSVGGEKPRRSCLIRPCSPRHLVGAARSTRRRRRRS